jgi:hypothetical protein
MWPSAAVRSPCRAHVRRAKERRAARWGSTRGFFARGLEPSRRQRSGAPGSHRCGAGTAPARVSQPTITGRHPSPAHPHQGRRGETWASALFAHGRRVCARKPPGDLIRSACWARDRREQEAGSRRGWHARRERIRCKQHRVGRPSDEPRDSTVCIETGGARSEPLGRPRPSWFAPVLCAATARVAPNGFDPGLVSGGRPP